MDSSKRTCALYLRVSTDGQSLDNQRPDLLRVAQARGLEITEIFEEKVSAAKHRPAYEKMKLAAHQGRFRCLLIWSLDRLGRSMIENISIILEMDRTGIEVVSVREQWLDTSGPVRSLLLAIFSWISEEERKQISARTKAGLARARSLGHQLGRPRKTVDLKIALELRAQGLSIREAAKKLKIGASTLHRIYQTHDVLEAATQKELIPETVSGGSVPEHVHVPNYSNAA